MTASGTTASAVPETAAPSPRRRAQTAPSTPSGKKREKAPLVTRVKGFFKGRRRRKKKKADDAASAEAGGDLDDEDDAIESELAKISFGASIKVIVWVAHGTTKLRLNFTFDVSRRHLCQKRTWQKRKRLRLRCESFDSSQPDAATRSQRKMRLMFDTLSLRGVRPLMRRWDALKVQNNLNLPNELGCV